MHVPAATMSGFVDSPQARQGLQADSLLAFQAIKCCMAKKWIKCADAICRVGFAHDIDMEMQQIQADIDRMQTQLELFANSSAVSSAHSQLQTSDVGQLVSPRTINTHHTTAPQSQLELQPFLFIGVLSVAGNAGDTQHHQPCPCIAAACLCAILICTNVIISLHDWGSAMCLVYHQP